MKNHPSAAPVDVRSQRQGELRTIVNPHHITRPHAREQGAGRGRKSRADEATMASEKGAIEAAYRVSGQAAGRIDAGLNFQLPSAAGHTTTDPEVLRNTLPAQREIAPPVNSEKGSDSVSK